MHYMHSTGVVFIGHQWGEVKTKNHLLSVFYVYHAKKQPYGMIFPLQSNSYGI